MTREELRSQYLAFVRLALRYADKARREGLLALEEEADEEKIKSRDVFEYGIKFVVDGTDQEYIEKILSNLVNQEKDENARIFKTIQKEAVIMIQNGDNPRILHATLNSYTDMTMDEEESALEAIDETVMGDNS